MMAIVGVTAAFVMSAADTNEAAGLVIGGEDWVPLEDSTAIMDGSVLDFSGMPWMDAPAGKHGRVVVRDGHFEFENLPGVKQRFYGVNLVFGACYMSEAETEELADRIARMGYNTVRIHHHERELCDKKDGTTIIPWRMEQLDNLMSACIKRGIYLTTDLYVSRNVPWRSCGIDRDGIIPMQEFKERILFQDGVYSNYLAFARQFLNHVNPKTGRRWADEPALAHLALVNEGNLGNNGYDVIRGLPEVKAALQDYDGAWRFAWSHDHDGALTPKSMNYFDVARDPLQRATERAVMTLFMRQDMKPLTRTYALTLPVAKLRDETIGLPQADMKSEWFGWYYRLGTAVAGLDPKSATYLYELVR